MKKIISILCVMAMVLSFAAFSVNAADNEITLSIKSQDAESTVLALTLNTVNEVKTIATYFDMTAAVEANVTITPASNVANVKATYNAAQKMLLVSYSPTDGSILTGEVELATVTLSAADKAYNVSRKPHSKRTIFKITAKDPNGGTDIDVTESFDFNHSVDVAPFSIGGGEEDDVNVIVPSDVKSVTTDAAATDCQIGTGIGLTANAGEAVFTKMIWALTSGENKLFSKVIELPGISGEFKVAATFINGSHNEKFDVEVVESVAIDAVNAIFTDGTADYFTDATDAALKAE